MQQLYKGIFLIILSILIGQAGFSQIRFGAKVGLNFTNAKFEVTPSNNNIKLGFNAGILAEISISKQFFIRPEVLYSTKGWRYPAIASIQDSHAGAFNLNYVNVPILLGYKPTKKLSIFLGPEVGLLVNAISRYDDNKVDLTDLYKKFDIGIDLGIAYKVIPKLGVELRYNYGFKEFIEYTYVDENGAPVGPIKDGSHRGLQIGLFYLFGGTK